jgi:hypothetical protein
MISKGLYMLLTQDPDTSAVVGTRVYFVLMPKGVAVPAVVLTNITTSDLYDAAGNTGKREGLWQIDCFAANYQDAAALQSTVRNLLKDYTGNLPDASATPVIATFIEKDWDMPYEEGTKGFVYRALLEVRFHYYDSLLPDTAPSVPFGVIEGGTVTTPPVPFGIIDGGKGTEDDNNEP